MMIYELFAGDKPWMRLFDYSASDPSKKLRDDIKTQVLAAKRPEVDRRWDKSLVDLMMSCWDQNPTARPSARQIYVRLLSEDELERLLEARGGGGDSDGGGIVSSSSSLSNQEEDSSHTQIPKP